jgi:type IV pilus assembly protein PilV
MKRRFTLQTSRQHQNGFTLLEVLIAAVVLSVGLLGAAALQIKGLQSAHSAYQRTIASIIATDAAERLWIDMHDGTIDRAAVETDWLAHWSASPVTLPNLTGSGSTITENSSLFTITVRWGEDRFEDGVNGTSEFVYYTRIFPPVPVSAP